LEEYLPMSVTEYERNQLFVWFEEHMGKERAATMMSLLPPVGWGGVATRRDIDHLAVATKRDLDHLAERLDNKIERVAERLDNRIDRVAEQMATKADLHDLQKTVVTWILTAQATVVAAIGLLLVALR
jgi:hypothetical protein